jgi:muramoyltetrapeptide carboxypeptidase
VHLRPRLDRQLLRANPKVLLGYSDITALHQALGQLGLVSLHGPMVARELADGPLAYDRASLWHALTGEGEPWQSGPEDLVPLRPGAAEGILRGGCLSLLAALAGTPWALADTGEPQLLLLEDVDEPPYRIDRMLRQLRLSGGLAGVRGIVFGTLPGCAGAETQGYSLERVVLEALADLEVPVAWGLASGHTTGPNLTLPLGVRARLRCGEGQASLSVLEAAVR